MWIDGPRGVCVRSQFAQVVIGDSGIGGGRFYRDRRK